MKEKEIEYELKHESESCSKKLDLKSVIIVNKTLGQFFFIKGSIMDISEGKILILSHFLNSLININLWSFT